MLMLVVKFYYSVPQISLGVEVSPCVRHRTAPPSEPLLQAALPQRPRLREHQRRGDRVLPALGEGRRQGGNKREAHPA